MKTQILGAIAAATLQVAVPASWLRDVAHLQLLSVVLLGLLAVVLSEGEHRWLLDHPGVELSIDIAQGFIELPDGGRFSFELEPFAKHCLLSGVDQLGFLLQHETEIANFEAARAAA